MPRGYRCIVLAFVGWLSLAAVEQVSARQGNSAETNQVEPPPPYAPYGPLSKDPCYRAQSHDTADLCAQWRAAFATEKAARAAQQAVTWTIVGTILSAVALVGLFLSLKQTAKTLQLARDNAYIELRSYLHPGIFKLEYLERNEWRCIVPLINAGSTPATDVKTHFVAKVLPFPFSPENMWDSKPANVLYPIFGPHAERALVAHLGIEPDDVEKIRKSKACIFTQLCVSYTTYSGESVTEPVIRTMVVGPEIAKNMAMKIVSQHALNRIFKKRGGRGKADQPEPDHS